MLSNDRFSSMRTTKCSNSPNLRLTGRRARPEPLHADNPALVAASAAAARPVPARNWRRDQVLSPWLNRFSSGPNPRG
jgi:hypothetical protein